MAPFRPVLAGTSGTSSAQPIGGDAVRTLHKFLNFAWWSLRMRAMITFCANCSCSCRRRSWLLVALLLENRDADRNHPDRGFCLVVAAAHCLPMTASSSLIHFLLTAREGIPPKPFAAGNKLGSRASWHQLAGWC